MAIQPCRVSTEPHVTGRVDGGHVAGAVSLEPTLFGHQSVLRHTNSSQFPGARHHLLALQSTVLEGNVQEAGDAPWISRELDTSGTSRPFDHTPQRVRSCDRIAFGGRRGVT